MHEMDEEGKRRPSNRKSKKRGSLRCSSTATNLGTLTLLSSGSLSLCVPDLWPADLKYFHDSNLKLLSNTTESHFRGDQLIPSTVMSEPEKIQKIDSFSSSELSRSVAEYKH